MPAQKTKYKIRSFFSTRIISIILLLPLGVYLLYRTFLINNMQPTTPESQHKKKYPSGIPDKFDLSGAVQPFAGNTILSHLPPTSPLHASMQTLYTKLASHPLAHLYTLLPPSSWHMTVFEGALDKRREPAFWPAGLDRNATIEECTSFLEEKLKSFDLGIKMPFHLRLVGFKPLVNGISIHVKAQTEEENVAIRGLRDRLVEAVGMKQGNHERYKFHLSVAYLLRFLSEEQEEGLRMFLEEHFEGMPKEFELGLPEFCKFEDMFKFERVSYLENKEE
jgi:hypothetical protein